jgi:hypothetical protein
MLSSFAFDSRSMTFETPKSGWDEQVLKLHHQNAQKGAVELSIEYGVLNFERKRDDLVEFGRRPFCMIGPYTSIMHQMHQTFVFGSYYSAMASACTLGELVYKDLLRKLAPYHGEDPVRLSTTQNWERASEKLVGWGIFNQELSQKLSSLKTLRNYAVHFVDFDESELRPKSLQACRLAVDITSTLFGIDGGRPWMLKGTKGAFFVAKEAETQPFVAEFVVPNCQLVGPWHRHIHNGAGGFSILDRSDYPDGEVTDEDFAKAYEARSDENMPPDPTLKPKPQ